MVSTQTKPSGLWRDRKLVIARRYTAVFPERCVKTNREDDLIQYEISVPAADSRIAAIAKPVLLTMAAILRPLTFFRTREALYPHQRRAIYRIWISRRWLESWKERAALGSGMVVLGMGVFIVLVFVFVFVLRGYTHTMEAFCVGIGLLISPLVSIMGVVFRAIFARPILSPDEMQVDFVWIRGCHPDFVASLPECPE